MIISESNGTGPHRRISAVDFVIESIKNRLISGELKPGELLPPENLLSQNLQVSRGSVREAMRTLSAYGIIEVRRGDGTYICNQANPQMFTPLLFKILVDGSDYRQLIELRNLLERGIVALIIRNAGEEDLRRLDSAHRRFAEVMEDERATMQQDNAADLAFHRTMGEVAGNSMTNLIYQFVMELFAPTIHACNTEVLAAHEEIVEAIHRRDLARAERAVDRHTQIWCRLQNIDFITADEFRRSLPAQP